MMKTLTAWIPINFFLIFLLVESSFSSNYTCDQNATCGCSSVSTAVLTARIVGGENAANYSWGWMASFQEDQVHRCGATLITAENAVTAAHCVYGIANVLASLSIVVGTNYLDDQTSYTFQRRSILSVIIHPDFNPANNYNDVAVLWFSPLSISPTSRLSLICLPNSNDSSFVDGSDLIAIGWGRTSENQTTLPNALQQVTVQAISSTAPECQQAPTFNATLKICAAVDGGGKDTCQGDSGGPLMAFNNNRWILVGITSSGIGCAEPNNPGLYTRVSAVVSFIQAVLNNQTITTSTRATLTVMNTADCIHLDFLYKFITLLLCCSWTIFLFNK